MKTIENDFLIDLARTARTPEELQQVDAWIAEACGVSIDEADEDESELEAGLHHGNVALERQNARTALTQEIGPLPPVKDPARRAKCKFDLKLYALTYFANACHMGLSPYQEEMLTAFQGVLLTGGKKTRAVRRGGLKSTIVRIASIWCVTNGHRKFPVPVGATDDKSDEYRDNIMQMIATSPTLLEDFPELIPLVFKMKNPKKQIRLGGELLKVTSKDERGCIVFPNIRGAECFCARLAPYSILATDVSGLSFVDDDGMTVRPDVLIFDDVQTPQSAKSFIQTNGRENAITTTFMGLAGLGETIAAIMVCTRREEDDLTSRFCNRERHPDWEGKSYPVLISEPTNKARWAEYETFLRSGDTPEKGFAAASAHYLEHQKEMDEGGEVAWEKDKEEKFATALQWAMTIKIIQPAYFLSELQQKGAAPQLGIVQLDADQIVKRLSHVPRQIVPAKASYLTAFVDSQDEVLFWMVCAWQKDFTGWIIDRGTWPDQERHEFKKSDLTRTISQQCEGRSWEEAFALAHMKVDEYLLRAWEDQNGSLRLVDLLLKDWSDGDHMPRIEAQVLASPNRSRIRPSKGFGPKPGKKPIHLYGDKYQDRHTASDWVERRSENPVHVQFDSNKWKSHAARRLQTVPSAPSSVLLWGDDEREHDLTAEHFTAEIAKKIVYDEKEGRVYEEIVGRDNDWWDCFVGNNVAASMLGCRLPGEPVISVEDDRETVSIPERLRKGGNW